MNLKKWGAQIFGYLRCINYVISDYSCIRALWSEPRDTVENMEHVIKSMEENWDNEVEWIIFWVRLGRICEFVPWARHSFIEGLWKNHLGFILEWRVFFILFYLHASCENYRSLYSFLYKSELLYPPCNVETQKYACMHSN